MRCTNCNKEIQKNVKFCPHCGTSMEEQEPIKKVSLQCKKCGGTLEIDSDKSVLACPYCGSQELIVENDAVTIEKIRASAHKEIELEKIKSNDRMHQIEDEKAQRQEVETQIEKFKKGKWGKFLIIAFLLAAVFTY